MYFVRGNVEFGTFTNDEDDVVHYYVKNVRGKILELSYDLWETLYEADETEPLCAPVGPVYSFLCPLGRLSLVLSCIWEEERISGLMGRYDYLGILSDWGFQFLRQYHSTCQTSGK